MRNSAIRHMNAKPGAEDRARLATLLDVIEKTDEAGAYDIRNKAVYAAVALAAAMGLEVGFRADPAEPEWPVAYIELPTGQVSWHLPQHVRSWDDHTIEEKYERVHYYINEVLKRPARKNEDRAD